VNINLPTVELTTAFERADQYFIEMKIESYRREKMHLLHKRYACMELLREKWGFFKIATANAAYFPLHEAVVSPLCC
jgi:hypothetical protein